MTYGPELVQGWSLIKAPDHLGPPDPTAGVYGANGEVIGFDDALLGRHVLFLGGIGTGKTVGMTELVRSMRAQAEPDDVFVFFDTKGDYLDSFQEPHDVVLARRARQFNGQVTWNLFSELNAAPTDVEADEDLAELAASLFEDVSSSAGQNNRIWSNIAQDVFSAVVLAMHRNQTGLSNANLRAIADEMTVRQMLDLIRPHPDLAGVAQYIAREDSNATLSAMIFLQQAIRRVFRSSFRQQGTFSVREFLRQKNRGALFLEFDVAYAETVTPVFRTVIDLALKEALGRAHAAGRVFFFLDEFALLPSLAHLDAGLNFGRGLGLRFVVGAQNVGQVTHAYGVDRAASILSGFGTVFAFRLYDKDSRDFVRARFGSNRSIIRYDAALKARGVVEELVDGSVVEDWDITGLQVGEAVAALPDSPPYRFRFAPPKESSKCNPK